MKTDEKRRLYGRLCDRLIDAEAVGYAAFVEAKMNAIDAIRDKKLYDEDAEELIEMIQCAEMTFEEDRLYRREAVC